MSEKSITVNFPAGHLISDAEVFLKEHGCTFEGCSENNIAYVKMIFPEGTKTRCMEKPQGMEYRRTIIFPDGTEVQEIHLRGRGSGPQYSQILWDEQTRKEMADEEGN